MDRCSGLREDLKAYLDGELGLSHRLRVRMHLARCARCSQEVAAMERIAEELRKGDVAELDAALRYRLLAHAAEAFPAALPARHGFTGPRRVLALWGAVAAAMLAVLISYRAVLRSPAELVEEARMAMAPAPSSESPATIKDVTPGSAPHGGVTAMSAESSPANGRASSTAQGNRPGTATSATRPHSQDSEAGAARVPGEHARNAISVRSATPRRTDQPSSGISRIGGMPGAAGASTNAKQGDALAVEAGAPPQLMTQAAPATGAPQAPETRSLAANLQVTHVLEVTLEVKSLKDRYLPLERLAVSISGSEPSREVTDDSRTSPEVTYRILVPEDKVEQVLAGLEQLGNVATRTRAGSQTANTYQAAETQGPPSAAARGTGEQQKPADNAAPPVQIAAPSAKERGAPSGQTLREPGKATERPTLGAPAAPRDRTDGQIAQRRAAPATGSAPVKQFTPAAPQRPALATPRARQTQSQDNRSKAGGARSSTDTLGKAEQVSGRLALITVHVQAERPAQQAPAGGPLSEQGHGR